MVQSLKLLKSFGFPGVFSRCLLLVLLMLPAVLLAAEITVSPDRDPIGVGEEFTLTFSTTEEPDADPDFTPLRDNFEIVSTTTSSNIQMINGVVSREMAWRVRLYPKATGTLDIPPIRFGNQSSPAAQITVDENAANAGLPRDGVLVELEVDTETPYVQQQFIVTQRMLHSVELMRSGASMSHPEVGEGKALVQQLGGVTNRTVNRKGIRYKVSERRYAVFPQTSGKLTFRPTVFQGVINTTANRQQRDPFGLIGGRQIRRFSAPLSVEVKPQPAGISGTWLPAQSVSINVHWQTPPDRLKTGEPVTLTLAVIADGLMAEQLPEIKLAPPQGVKGYSNQPELRNNHQGDSLIGTRQERWILIGTAPGEYTLPAISLEWWNLATGKTETAIVAETKLTVSGEVSGAASTNNLPGNGNGNNVSGLAEATENTGSTGAAGESNAGDAAQSGSAAQELLDNTGGQQVKDGSNGLGQAAWLLAPGILLLIGLGVLYRRNRGDRHLSVQQAKPVRVDYYRQLERACQHNEAQKAYDALSDWVRHDLQLTPPTIAQLRQETPMSFKQALDELSMALYARQTDAWQGADLWREVQNFRTQQQTAGFSQRRESDLLALYPD
ncbi:MAG: BatD family protein [Thiolinea sp.]